MTIKQLVAGVLALWCGLVPAKAGKTLLRVGHFPNITHAQALVATQMKREGKGWFEERLGPEVTLQWYVYNAGPSAMEAIFANSVDLTYVGPSPLLNAYTRSQGKEIRVVAGAAVGGAALVVQQNGITKPEDFRGKKIGTPQLGNTQDVAARFWLKKQGYKITQLGGDVMVLPTSNPDQLALFKTGQLDGVWTVEPWVSRLELEAKGRVYLEQKEEVTTVLACSVKALGTKGDLVKAFVKAHWELTQWINDHPEEARRLVRAALKELTKRDLAEETATRAWGRLKFTADIQVEPLQQVVEQARSVGFLKKAPSLDALLAVPKE